MADYKNMPVQRGLSDEPLYRSNPRKYARKRCDLSADTCDKAIQYLGSIIQVYIPENMPVQDAISEGLALIAFAKENGITFDTLIDYASTGKMDIGNLGQFAGYIAICALCINNLKDISDSIRDMKRSI